MTQDIRRRAAAVAWPALIGALFALGLLLPVMQAIRMEGISLAVWASILTAASCAVFGWGRATRVPGVILGVVLLGLLAAFSGVLSNLGGMVSAAIHLVRGNADPLRVYGPEAAFVLGILLTLAGCAMARQSAGFYPALSLMLVTVLIVWFTGNRDVIAWFIPALVALCAMFARSVSDETPMVRIVAVSAVVVVLAAMLSPALQIRSNRLETFAERLRTYITDTLFFTEPRSIYTIQSDGFKPLQTRLGGPIELSDRPVMTVETEKSILLRGTLYNDYNGLNWTDTLSLRRYLYSDPRNRAIRADALDEQRPSQSLRSTSFFSAIDVTVTMNADSASTLFSPQRAADISMPMDMVPYFNMAGELFITRDLAAGDTYSLTAPVISADDPSLPGILSSAAAGGDTKELSYYSRVPEAVASEVYQLVAEVTYGAGTPLEKALAIRNYLRSTYPYTTTPDVPPDNQDFVSYFLLRGKEGYCVYFASAMAVMGRIAGLPTRYVEGYSVDPSGGTALVRSKNAHAWTEVYFDGFGWVAFDATPPRGLGGPQVQDRQTPPEGPEDTPPEEGEQPQGEDDPEDTPPGEGGDTEPPPDSGTPEEEPTPSPSPSPEPEDDSVPDEEPTPSPSPEDEPTPQNLEGPTPPKPRSYWWAWLLALLVIGLLVWRGLWTRPAFVAQKLPDDASRLLAWYRALLGLLAASGMPARPHETPVAYAARVEQGIPEEAGLMAVADAVTQLGYGKQDSIGPAEVQAAAGCYSAVWKAVPVKGKLVWLLRRMLHGIGDIRQVP